MAQGRLRRLVTRWIQWVWVPIVAFFLVAAVAMGCAVWSPVHRDGRVYGPDGGRFEPAARQLPWALRQYGGPEQWAEGYAGFGFSFYAIIPDDWMPHAIGWEENLRPRDYPVTVGRAGFPFRCLRWTVHAARDHGRSSSATRGIQMRRELDVLFYSRRIPVMPEPVGMVLNVLIVSAALALPRATFLVLVPCRRKRRNLCVKCGYPLGDFAICPECGKPTGREA